MDLIIAPNCVHWLDSEKWLNSVKGILNYGGVLAYWGYVDPVFTKIEGSDDKNRLKIANDEYNAFVYEEKGKLGEYWEQPGRNKLRSSYKEINDIIWKDRHTTWEEILLCRRDPLTGDNKFFGSIDGENKHPPDFQIRNDILKMEIRVTFEELLNYMDTWSSSFKWNSSHKDKVSSLFGKILEEKIGLNRSDKIVIEMKTISMMTRK